jgi:hypothetical protein
MIAVQDIINRVTDLLLDKERGDDEARWSDSELLRWINDSRSAIIIRRPQAGSVVENATLVAGTLQSIPSDGITFLDAIRNMGTSGTTPGRVIRRTDRQSLDDDDLYWHAATASNEISQFTFDDRVPTKYYVYPPALAGTRIELAYAKTPSAVTTTGDNLNFQDEYMEAVVNYVCYRAKSKDSEFGNAGEATAFFAAFNDSLGVNKQAKTETSPNQPGNSV